MRGSWRGGGACLEGKGFAVEGLFIRQNLRVKSFP